MKVRDILEQKGRRVITIRPDATISTAVHRMALEKIGALIASEDGAAIAGILSERDVLHGLAQDGAAVIGHGSPRRRPDDHRRAHLQPRRSRQDGDGGE